MTLLTLFLAFLQVGMFAFGGAYGAIPLIRETIQRHGWMDEGQLMSLLGISESTPGPIMVNAATMTGFSRAGAAGAAAATLGVILPSFLIMLLLPRLQKKWRGHRIIRTALRGVKPCLAGIICANGVWLIFRSAGIPAGPGVSPDLNALLLIAVSAFMMGLYRVIRKKPIPPILLILLSAAAGICLG